MFRKHFKRLSVGNLRNTRLNGFCMILVSTMMLLQLMIYWTFTITSWKGMTYYNKMLGFIKRCCFRGLVFLSTLTSANSFSGISMNNQEWPQIANVNGDDPAFFRFSIKTSKCSGSWKISIIHAQNCVFLML